MLKKMPFLQLLRSLFISLMMLLVLGTALHAQGPIGIATGSLPGQIVLNWTVPSQPSGVTLAGYNVYRATTAGGEAGTTALNGATPITSTTYTDTTATPGVPYFYVATAQSSTGQQSAFSNEAAATVPVNPNPPTLSTPTIQITSVTRTVNGNNTTLTAVYTNSASTLTDYVFFGGNSFGSVLGAGNCNGSPCNVSVTVPTASVGVARFWVIDRTGQFALY